MGGNSRAQSVEGMDVGNLDLTLPLTYVHATFASVYICVFVYCTVWGFTVY